MIMDRLYGGVCYAGIDTDPELKYPKGKEYFLAIRADYRSSRDFESVHTVKASYLDFKRLSL